MKTIGEVYLHVSNSGATLKVVDDGNGPELVIETSAFGNLNQVTQIKTTQVALQALRELFAKAVEHPFSPAYCHAANLRNDGENPGVAQGSIKA